MTDTAIVPRKPEGSPAGRPLIDEELADQLLGPDGLLSQVTKRTT
jgi:hypothetical protein